MSECIEQRFDHPVFRQRFRIEPIASKIFPHRVPSRSGSKDRFERIVVDLIAETSDTIRDRLDDPVLVGLSYLRLELGEVERRLRTLGGHW
ncbi:hypothetical protein BRD01_05200 [Halobacteriales archaeon QS_8_65_32]|nr:MAG: hypothetical protein BRD01_05200 [Halobacteriales archaeon QS_8_65_32]